MTTNLTDYLSSTVALWMPILLISIAVMALIIWHKDEIIESYQDRCEVIRNLYHAKSIECVKAEMTIEDRDKEVARWMSEVRAKVDIVQHSQRDVDFWIKQSEYNLRVMKNQLIKSEDANSFLSKAFQGLLQKYNAKTLSYKKNLELLTKSYNEII